MKVLFLDIDGVLNSTRTACAFGRYPFNLADDMKYFDHTAIGIIRAIVRQADAKIVLSSAWRYHFPHEDVARALALPIIDSTPQSYNVRKRGCEIKEWLNDHPEVTQYVIVDDDADMLPDQKEWFVNTDPSEGLSWESAKRIAELFGVSVREMLTRNRDEIREVATA